MPTKTPPPKSLAAAGKALWRKHVAKYDLRVDELAILHGACRAADMIAKLEEVWADEGCPQWAKGSMGQLVEHPAPKAVRAWQAAHDTALARLKLPDEETDPQVNQNRDAAKSSWAPGVRGRGA
ncbi:MAG TPA: hypothetical protein VFJ19_08835 [Nocardioidaceae bacterium]|nr:hypothetical protein [Nocardioidaceae bacterium]